MNFLKSLFGNKTDGLRKLLDEGAVIVDVRTPYEYNSGHIKGSKNVPLDSLRNRVDELRRLNKPLITVCQSGMRSRSASAFLKSKGLDATNGGGWSALNNVI